MDLEETETRNDYAGKSQQKFDRQTYSQSGLGGQELPSWVYVCEGHQPGRTGAQASTIYIGVAAITRRQLVKTQQTEKT
jgi:hypothetical protein